MRGREIESQGGGKTIRTTSSESLRRVGAAGGHAGRTSPASAPGRRSTARVRRLVFHPCPGLESASSRRGEAGARDRQDRSDRGGRGGHEWVRRRCIQRCGRVDGELVSGRVWHKQDEQLVFVRSKREE